MPLFTRTTANNTDFQFLVSLLDADLAIRDGDEHDFYNQFNKITNLQNIIICYHHQLPVGCGAFKKYTETTVEIKRMFVHPSYRGKGFAFSILQSLEIWAKELKYNTCILETGKKQPEAINLYKKAGYQIIENYGQYKNVENSVCMYKGLENYDS